MSIQGPSGLPFRPLVPDTHAASHAAKAAHRAYARAQGSAASPEATPPNDSSLWDLLTEDERAFFSQQNSLGALTYGRGRAAASTAPAAGPIGQRLDVRG
jgi:hypothetical protein